MAINTRRTNLKGIEKAIAEFKSQNAEFKSGETYVIEYVNGCDETREYEVPVDAGSPDPEKSILDAWEDYLLDDEREYCFEDLETVCCVTGIFLE